MDYDDEDAAEARVIVLGTPIDGDEALFLGSLEDAVAFVHALPPEQQDEVAIVTDGRIYDPHEV